VSTASHIFNGTYLAATKRYTSPSIIRAAIAEYVSREEKRLSFLQDALAAWKGYQETGIYQSWEESDVWPGEMGTDQHALDPKTSYLRWTPAALHDVKRVHDFLAPRSLDMAQKAVQAIQQRAQALAIHPEMGHPVAESLSGLRELLIDFGLSAYLVLYRNDGEQIAILAVRHGREAGY
jgi:plasmid stabilization system protein ParE/predicted transcriptional regulator